MTGDNWQKTLDLYNELLEFCRKQGHNVSEDGKDKLFAAAEVVISKPGDPEEKNEKAT